MKVNPLTLKLADLPDRIKNISHPPKQLYCLGKPLTKTINIPTVAVIGSRKATLYGRQITHDLVVQLSKQGIAIVSGLAFGIDSYAHCAALESGGYTIAVLPSPLEKIYPASHSQIAEQILLNGGTLVSEYRAGTDVRNGNFIARNRLISALADVLVIPEAAKNSGSLHTARFGLEQGKTVMAVPGSINSPMSEGTNNLIKSGAIPITDVEDIFFALGINRQAKKPGTFQGTLEEEVIFNLICQGIREQESLALVSKLPTPQIGSTLTSLELKGYIRPAGAGNWLVA
ncbi:MAG TPA: DNA-processing protein DprA [Candidatus Saccharimonadales bacterium]|nr:DNA-processing protein DprA [Candidatus Saccharimonadales bacterium]